MHRIDGDAHVSNMFDPGDPGVPRPPTQVTHSWLNAVQEEFANAIEGAGIALNKLLNDQLQKVLGLLGSGANAGPGSRWFSGLHSWDVATGGAILASTSSSTPTDVALTGSSELATGVAAATTDGLALKATVYGGGTGDALQVTGPMDLDNAAVKNSMRFTPATRVASGAMNLRS